ASASACESCALHRRAADRPDRAMTVSTHMRSDPVRRVDARRQPLRSSTGEPIMVGYMILACHACDSRYDVTGHPVGQQFRCRCGAALAIEAPSSQAGLLACPHCGAGVGPTETTCAHCSSQLLLKACPRCLSRVFHGHRHCPECGSELSVAATDGHD